MCNSYQTHLKTSREGFEGYTCSGPKPMSPDHVRMYAYPAVARLPSACSEIRPSSHCMRPHPPPPRHLAHPLRRPRRLVRARLSMGEAAHECSTKTASDWWCRGSERSMGHPAASALIGGASVAGVVAAASAPSATCPQRNHRAGDASNASTHVTHKAHVALHEHELSSLCTDYSFME